jgi:methyl-accepting chemotaxis protein
VTQQNAALVEEAAAAAQSLQEQAGRLSQVVRTFKLDDEDEKPVAAQPKPAPVRTRPMLQPVRPARPAIAAPPRKQPAAGGTPLGGGDWETF